ncbi:MAG TPA: acylneuraminate cytidylyltransferase family protein [Leeuwenhoekiella sp.]|nr:acylneuraminate cytidylyltransferase family protein [Leeuwenhoekiella sp.]
MRILGIIPARGGSKGVPGKNKKLLGGKPLIVYSIEEGLKSNDLDRLIVSTNDPEIAEISKKAGAKVPFMRPEKLAQDDSSSIDFVIHALDFFEAKNIFFDAVCLLQPTVPFRKAEFIDAAIQQFESKDTDCLISVRVVPHQFNPYWVFEKKNDNLLERSKNGASIIKRRQELPEAFYRDGSIYLTKAKVIKADKSLFGKKIDYIVSNDSEHVNIDTLDDWKKAEIRIKKQ